MVRKNLATLVFAVFGIVVLTTGNLFAQLPTEFSEDFNTGTLGPNISITGADPVMAPGNVGGGDVPVTTGNNVVFGSVQAEDAGRAFVATNETNFADVNFIASVNVEIQPGGGANAFFGLGLGESDGNVPGAMTAFGEPSTGPAVFGTFNSTNRDGEMVNVGDFNAGMGGISQITNDIGTQAVGDGIHRLIIDNDFFNGTLTFSVILNIPSLDADPNTLTGTPVVLGSIDTSDNGFDATNSRIFFGGDDNTAFDNFVVEQINDVPEVVCDTNGNGICNTTDFEAIRDNLFTAGGRIDGDLNGDGFVDFEDFRIFKDNPARVLGLDPPAATASASIVPEPASAVLLGASLLAFITTRRRSVRS